MTGTVVAAVVAAVALCGGAGVVDSGKDGAAAPSGRTGGVTTDHRGETALTTLWRPR